MAMAVRIGLFTVAPGLWATLLAAQAAPPTSSPYEIVGSAFAAVRVSDAAAAAEWYSAKLGVRELNRLDADDGRYAIRILGGNGLTVELIQERGIEGRAERSLGLFKAGLYVRDIAALHAYLRDNGVDTDDRVFVDRTLDARSFVFRDLEGNRFQAFEPCNGTCGPGT